MSVKAISIVHSRTSEPPIKIKYRFKFIYVYVYIYIHYITRPDIIHTFTILQSYVQEVARVPPFRGCLRPIEAWTELRTRTDRRTYWQGLAWAGGGLVGNGGGGAITETPFPARTPC